MADKKRILVTRDFPPAGIDRLKENSAFELTQWEMDRPMTREELLERAKDHDVVLCTLTERIDREFLEACSHLEMISQFAVGYDNIDVAAAAELGIPVGFTPDAMSDATADIAFGLMIASARKMFYLHNTIAKGEWGYFRPRGHLGVELSGKTLGIFGMGRIGMKTAQRCRGAYNMEILYCSRNRKPEAEKELDAALVDFDTLLGKSDIVSAHCALTAGTRHIFNRDAFERMKPEAIFINTARGPIHHEPDLIRALEGGEIRGAGLDVTDPEPMRQDNPLLFMENVCVLPHVGSGTNEARNEMSAMAADNIVEFYRNGRIPHIVNPEVLSG
ncbi:MAG: D-glycerate dehydrogenase [Desulfarculaceae bacterium]|nr:D-glycerate dehydrogenase [Desulfarculaceae bacterium]